MYRRLFLYLKPDVVIGSASGTRLVRAQNHDVSSSLSAQQHRIRFTDSVETRSLIFPLSASLHGPKECRILFRIQQRFLTSNLRIIPVYNTPEIINSMLTIAKATSKPHVDSVRDQMTMAKAQIIERSSAWEMLRNLQLGYE